MRVLPAILVVIAAATASAQGFPGGAGGGMGGRRGMGGGRGGDGMGRAAEAPPNPSAKDVEKHDPVKLLLDKHKKLKLDKTQIAQLTTLGASLGTRNGPYYQRVDSLHDTFKPPSFGGGARGGSEDGRASVMENRQLLYETLTQIRSNNKTARDSAIVLLREPQKKKAYDMLEKQLEDSDKLMRRPGFRRPTT